MWKTATGRSVRLGNGIWWVAFTLVFTGTAFGSANEIAINSLRDGDQLFPSVARSATGESMVVWESRPPDEPSQVRGRVIGSSGEFLNEEFALGPAVEDAQLFPRVAAYGAGFLAVWIQDGDPERRLLARFYSAEGAPEGQPVTVAQGAIGIAAVATQGDVFAVAWLVSGGEISIRTGDADALNPPQSLLPSGGSEVDVAPTGNLGFLVAWSYPYGFGDSDVEVRPTDLQGVPRGPVQTVSIVRAESPALAPVSGGRVVVAHRRYGISFGDGVVWGVVVDDLGQTVGEFFRLDPDDDEPARNPAVTTVDGGFTAAWGCWAGEDAYDVCVGHFDEAGAPLRDVQRSVNQTTTQSQRYPALSSAAGGDTLAVWWSQVEPGGDGGGIFGSFVMLFFDEFETGDLGRWSREVQ